MWLLNIMIAVMVVGVAANRMFGVPQGKWNSWTKWEDQDECKVMCGGGFKLQERTRTCHRQPCVGDFAEQRNETCNTQSCGDKCPQGEKTYIPHPVNPQRFYQCANGRAWLHRCPGSTVWNQSYTLCIWP